MNTVLIFDYDGVIVDSLDIFMKLFINACKENGWKEISSKQDFLSLFNGNMYEKMMKLGMKKQDILSIVLQVKKGLLNNLEKLQLFPKMKQTLIDLSNQHTLCISTSNDTSIVKNFLKINQIFCFDQIYGSDINHSKIKKIDMIKKRYPSDNYAYIGDTIGDIEEGKKADVITIAATWGWHSKDKLQQSKPDHLIDSIEDLPKIASLII